MQLLSAGSGASAGTLPRACGKLPERCAHRRTTQINSNTQYGTLSVAIEGRLMPLAGAARKCAAVRTEHCGKTEGFHTVEDTYRNSIALCLQRAEHKLKLLSHCLTKSHIPAGEDTTMLGP